MSSDYVVGEVYRVDLDGTRVDLSASPGDDTLPLVSPDGRRVAFLSDRNQRGPLSDARDLYVVGTDGRGLQRLASNLPAQQLPGQAAWSPDSRRLVVAGARFSVVGGLQSSLFLVEPGRRRLLASGPGFLDPAWSPDGRLIGFEASDGRDDRVEALTPEGRRVLSVRGIRFAWSARGRLAVYRLPEKIRVYSARGRFLAAFSAQRFAWSPDGSRLATLLNGRLEVRRDGVPLFLRRRVRGAANLVWAGRQRLVLEMARGGVSVGARSLDLTTGRISRASRGYFDLVSPDGSRFAVVTRGGSTVSRLDGSERRTLVRLGDCPDLTQQAIAWLPSGRSLVYEFKCQHLNSDLFTMAADGSRIHRLTSGIAAGKPVWSPDGRWIAYVRPQSETGAFCNSCQSEIWVMRADGSHARRLTARDGHDRREPSWSPDGKTIVFAESDLSTPYRLVTIPARGGPEHDLHVVGESPAWGRRRIAYVRDSGPLETVLPNGKEVRPIATGVQLWSPTWSRDGRLAYLQPGRTGTMIHVLGHKQHTFRLRRLRADSLAWSADGHSLFLTAGTGRNLSPAAAYSLRLTDGHLTRLTRLYAEAGGISAR